MTTFVTAAPAVCTAVLSISAMPVALRPAVEECMYRCIPSSPELEIPGIDPLDANWFTRWQRCTEGLSTRQVLTGYVSELEEFSRQMGELSCIFGFKYRLQLVD